VRFGVQVIHQRGDDLLRLGRAVDATSFDGIWLAGGGDNYLKAAVLLSATNRVLVGTSIMPCLLASPSLHATSARFLQASSGGRFVLGMGSQTKGQIRAALGIDPSKPAKMAREVIEITRALLRSEAIHYKGEFYQMERGATMADSGPPPPLYYSGVNRMNLRIAGRYSDGFLAHPIFTKRYLEEVVWPEIDTGLARAGKSRSDFHMVAMPMCWVIDSESERVDAIRRGKRNIAYYFTTRAYGSFMEFHGWTGERDAIQEILRASGGRIDYARLEETIPSAIVDDICLIGTTEEVRQKAAERYSKLADTLDFYSIHDGGDSAADRQRLEFENAMRVLAAFDGQKLA
jgi:alkanesulfonate monooxygenase SsuD/methylene tetrahydromethanopterin reductase-like flavin-dependent oxidoreductase (luciferase family)